MRNKTQSADREYWRRTPV